MKVEAGTYIKELVHGDLGRTVPNVSLMLGLEADILALDVEVTMVRPRKPLTSCSTVFNCHSRV